MILKLEMIQKVYLIPLRDGSHLILRENAEVLAIFTGLLDLREADLNPN